MPVMKRLMPVLAVLFCFAIVASVAAQELALRMDPLVQEAIQKNPKIIAARERYAALKERVSQAGALEDPMLGFGVVSLPSNLDFNREDMTAKEISVSQKFPFPGKLDLNAQAAAREAEAGAAEVEDIANQVVKEVKSVFYDLSHVDRATAVTRRNKRLLEDLSRIAQSRYSLGQGIQEDIIRIQVEIAKMVDDLILLEQKKRSLAAWLNFLLNRPSDSPVEQPEEVDFRRADFSIQDLQQQALAGNPMLKALKQEIAARGKTAELAKRDFFPDFNLKLAYGQRDDRLDMYTGMIEVNLPVFFKSKQARKAAEENAGVRSAQARYDDAQNEILYTITATGSMVQRLERKIELYRTGIIPQTRLQIDAALSAYMVNKADFMTLLDSRMQLYRYELEYHEALTEYEKSFAALEAAVGTQLSREVVK